MKMKIILATLALTITPALAFANPVNRDQTVRTHSSTVHDRTPQVHDHGTSARR